jgi:hypothetical protein
MALDRAYARAEIGPLAVLVGRDVVVLGPSARTQSVWGDHAGPLDQVRVSTARPLALVGAGGSVLRVSALFFLGRLRDPQRFHGALVDGTRLQADLWDAVELGLSHLIQIGGNGAPDFSFGDYLLEHTRHNPESGDFANHRLAADVAVSLPRVAGLRIYYEVASEDLRDDVLGMLRYDADHVLGVELDRLASAVGLLLELTRTGVRSHEHHLFTTGMTNAGRIAGAPLGPDSRAVFAGARFDLADRVTLSPWLELARQSADYYHFPFPSGEIERTQDLPDEWRARAGVRWSMQLSSHLRLEARAMSERVTTADFIPARIRWNAAVEAAVVWTPAWRAGL